MKKLFAKKENDTQSAEAGAVTEKKKKVGSGNRKKIIVICTMVCLLVAAAYLNVVLAQRNQQGTGDLTPSVTTVSAFAAMRSDRDTVRAQTYSYLDSIIQSDASSQDAKKTAEDKKMALIEYASEEVVLENLIKARGFADVCVTMSTGNINVMVQSAELTQTEVAQILYIITEETGAKATDVVIVSKS